jgi:hypothetical protein
MRVLIPENYENHLSPSRTRRSLLNAFEVILIQPPARRFTNSKGRRRRLPPTKFAPLLAHASAFGRGQAGLQFSTRLRCLVAKRDGMSASGLKIPFDATFDRLRIRDGSPSEKQFDSNLRDRLIVQTVMRQGDTAADLVSFRRAWL